MRRSTLRQSSGLESDADRWKSALRSVQWSAYYERFFGGVGGSNQVPSSFTPLPARQVLGTLVDACGCVPKARKNAYADALRRTVRQILLTGYDLTDLDEAYNAAMRAALDGAAGKGRSRVADAARSLMTDAEHEFPMEDSFRRRAFSLEEELTERERRRDLAPLSVPTQVTHRGDAFSVQKQVYFRQRLSAPVKRLVNPLNWTELGEFFTTTERGDRKLTTAAHRRPQAWRGVLHEIFTVTWNGFTTQSFDQLLEVDYTVVPDLARTDYFLMYEQDDQIALNEGYFEAKEDAAHPGWMSVTMVKTVKFTSSVLNLLAPAILAMFLDSQAGGFRAFVKDRPARAHRE